VEIWVVVDIFRAIQPGKYWMVMCATVLPIKDATKSALLKMRHIFERERYMSIGKLYSISSLEPVSTLSELKNEGADRRNGAIKSPLANAVSGVGSKHLYTTCKLNKWGNAFEGFSPITKDSFVNPRRKFSSNVVAIAPKSVINKQLTAKQERRNRNQTQSISLSSVRAGKNIVDMRARQNMSLPKMSLQSEPTGLDPIREELETRPATTLNFVMPATKHLDLERKKFMQSMLSDVDDNIAPAKEKPSTYHPAQECVCAEQGHAADGRAVACPLEEAVGSLKADIDERSLQTDSAYGSTQESHVVDDNIRDSSASLSFAEKVGEGKDDVGVYTESRVSSEPKMAQKPSAIVHPMPQNLVSSAKGEAKEKTLLADRHVPGGRSRTDARQANKGAIQDDWDLQEVDAHHPHEKVGRAEELNMDAVKKILGDWARGQHKYLPRIM